MALAMGLLDTEDSFKVICALKIFRSNKALRMTPKEITSPTASQFLCRMVKRKWLEILEQDRIMITSKMPILNPCPLKPEF